MVGVSVAYNLKTGKKQIKTLLNIKVAFCSIDSKSNTNCLIAFLYSFNELLCFPFFG
jgi:hypothetical protein